MAVRRVYASGADEPTLTVTEITPDTNVDQLIKDQFLAADLDDVVRLQKLAQKHQFKAKIVWRNVAIFVVLHIAALVGLYQLLFTARWLTVVWTAFCYLCAGLGITAGAHRLWAHRSFRARLPLRLFLVACNCVSLQNDIIEWSRDHRSHHKWTDTDADPHNMNRGFFFAHMGWLMLRKHPRLREMGAKLDLADLKSDALLAFQRKHYYMLVLLLCVLIPTAVPVYFWNESALVAFYVACVLRYCAMLHATWFINSVAHTFGYKPYNSKITPTESVWTTVAALGEGGHNYHHSFPQDYRTSEMPYALNVTRLFIDACAALGLAYDLRTVSTERIDAQKARNTAELEAEKRQHAAVSSRS